MTVHGTGWVPEPLPTARRRRHNSGRRVRPGTVAGGSGGPGDMACRDDAASSGDAGSDGADHLSGPGGAAADGAGSVPAANSAGGVPEAGDTAAAGGVDLAAPVETGEPERAAWAGRLTTSGPWGALAEKWIPEPLRGARVDPGRRGMILLSLVAAIAASAAAVGVWWAKPEVLPIGSRLGDAAIVSGSFSMDGDGGTARVTATPSAAAYPGADAAAASGPGGSVRLAGSTTASAVASPIAPEGVRDPQPNDGPILVSVTGKVRRPGLVTVPSEARVADAIAAAGGVADTSLLVGLNLAAHLSDGASIVVAGPGGSTIDAEAGVGRPPSIAGVGSPVSPASRRSTDGAELGLISINAADAAALQTLPGVGPVTADAIVTYRNQHGPFTELAQLQEVPRIGPATYARIAPHATL